jgi:hypothetical protein
MSKNGAEDLKMLSQLSVVISLDSPVRQGWVQCSMNGGSSFGTLTSHNLKFVICIRGSENGCL